jgi:hypothetical protein
MRILATALAVVCVCGLAAVGFSETDMGTAITYQGKLTDAGLPANGAYDLRFILYDSSVAGSQVGPVVALEDVTITNGLFTVSLDFGAGGFAGQARWLDIAVRPGSDTGAYTSLVGRQELKPAPSALYSKTAGSASAVAWSSLTDVPAGFADGVDNENIGDITSVVAGTGLTGGATTGDATLALDTAYTNAAYVNASGDAMTGPLQVAGNVQISGSGNGLLFPDGTTQTTAAFNVPSGAVMFFNLASCPTGWSALVAARGRYIVGVLPTGTLGATVGTSLTNGQNRAAGIHSHTASSPGHTHTVAHSHKYYNFALQSVEVAAGTGAGAKFWYDISETETVTPTTSGTAVGVTVDNAGTGDGTPAPYVQLLACQKN